MVPGESPEGHTEANGGGGEQGLKDSLVERTPAVAGAGHVVLRHERRRVGRAEVDVVFVRPPAALPPERYRSARRDERAVRRCGVDRSLWPARLVVAEHRRGDGGAVDLLVVPFAKKLRGEPRRRTTTCW